ncbi:hypothetical protein [Bombilactobacillus thymidiniphilus]|uniref:DUF5082 domain-containing protein n=1 Tax=Bombilactobacillus thymidiniphilus TaxID=2923363 RepID=A0ABY4PEM6_9LACO|nr:hypothetical protein [Bombilactobacillus thymidiniphilus]UQS84244.1 hypothetical protein MOO47_03595 [Bombilactobacillus thymidiniphilus]
MSDKKDKIRQEQRRLQQAYEEKLTDLTRQQRQIEQQAQETAQRGSYWLHKVDPTATNQEVYHLVEEYQAQTQDIITHQRRQISNEYEQQSTALRRKLEEQ